MRAPSATPPARPAAAAVPTSAGTFACFATVPTEPPTFSAAEPTVPPTFSAAEPTDSPTPFSRPVAPFCERRGAERRERALGERLLPERELPERELAGRELPERELAERELPERGLPERGLPEREPLDRGLAVRELPDRRLPELALRERDDVRALPVLDELEPVPELRRGEDVPRAGSLPLREDPACLVLRDFV
jgi:hypothetical protein